MEASFLFCNLLLNKESESEFFCVEGLFCFSNLHLAQVGGGLIAALCSHQYIMKQWRQIKWSQWVKRNNPRIYKRQNGVALQCIKYVWTTWGICLNPISDFEMWVYLCLPSDNPLCLYGLDDIATEPKISKCHCMQMTLLSTFLILSVILHNLRKMYKPKYLEENITMSLRLWSQTSST